MFKIFSKIWVVVIAVIFLAGGIFAWQYFGAPKEEVKAPEEEIKPPEEIIQDETAGWKTYQNEDYSFEFKYPDNWSFGEPDKNAYFDFIVASPPMYLPSKEKFPQVIVYLEIFSFSKSSLEEWNKKIKESIEKEEAIGDPAGEIWVDPSILQKDVGATCNLQINFSQIHNCKIVEINDKKFLQFLRTNIYTDEVELTYRTVGPDNQRWFIIDSSFSVITNYNPVTRLYTYLNSRDLLELLTKILNNEKPQGEIENIISKKVADFNQMLSTFRFLESK